MIYVSLKVRGIPETEPLSSISGLFHYRQQLFPFEVADNIFVSFGAVTLRTRRLIPAIYASRDRHHQQRREDYPRDIPCTFHASPYISKTEFFTPQSSLYAPDNLNAHEGVIQ